MTFNTGVVINENYDILLGATYQGIGDVKCEGVVTTLVVAHILAVYKDRATPVNSAKVEQPAIVLMVGGQCKLAVIPPALLVVLLHNA